MNRSVARMESLVEDLLDVSAIHCSALALHRKMSDLGQICKLAAGEQTLITQRTISLALPAEPIFASVDPERIQQVVSNLLSNAIKYSPPDRPVTLRLRRTDGNAVASVRDEGPGIPPDALPHLFKQFYRVPGIEETAGSRKGLGLGLYLPCDRRTPRRTHRGRHEAGIRHDLLPASSHRRRISGAGYVTIRRCRFQNSRRRAPMGRIRAVGRPAR